MRKNIRRTAWVAGIAATFALGTAPVAMASGIGNTVNGCTAQWFNTAFSMNCNSVSSAGNYRDRGNCQVEPDRNGPIVYLATGTTRNGVSSGACTWQVVGNVASYLGG